MSSRESFPSAWSRAFVVVSSGVVLSLLPGCSLFGDDEAADPPTTTQRSADREEERPELVSTYASNGGTMTVVVGDRIRVVLAGPSWTFLSTSDESVVAQDGNTDTVAASDGCGTGGECGYSTAYFDVLANGEAEIRASRSDCRGAEEGCVTGDEAFRLTISAPET